MLSVLNRVSQLKFIFLLSIFLLVSCGSGEDSSENGDGPVKKGTDTTPPVITLNGDNPMTIVQGTPFNDPGATANDDVDGPVAVSMTHNINIDVPNSYTATYAATDAAGNTGTATRTVDVVAPTLDTIPPVITLIGDNPMTIVQDTPYNEPGATAIDNVDGDISNTIIITDSVDINTPDDYTITYSVTDAANNTSSEDRTVTVTVNIPPTASNLNKAEAFTEDDAAFALTAIAIGDPDSANVTATLSLSNTNAGSISTGTSGTVTSTFMAGVWSASGPIANVNALLGSVQFSPATNFDQTFVIATEITDGRNTLNGSKTVTVTPVNDAPQFNPDLGNQTHQEGTTVSVDASATDIESIVLSYSATGLPNGLSIDTKTGQISGSITAVPANYSVSVTVDDLSEETNSVTTTNFVWTITPLELETDPAQTTATILPADATITAGTPVNFTITVRDTSGAIKFSGDDVITMSISGANSYLTATDPLTATYNNNGTYYLSYTPQVAGTDTYDITVDISGQPVSISGSYRKIIDADEASAASSTQFIPPGPYNTGQIINLSAMIRDQYGNLTNAAVEFRVTGDNAVSLTGESFGIGLYSAAFNPINIGTDSIVVLVNGTAIRNAVVVSTNQSSDPPILVSTNPADNQENMAINQRIELLFDRPVFPVSVNTSNFTVTTGGSSIAGIESFADNKIIFTPNSLLEFGRTYSVSYSGTVEDYAGNTVILSKQWSTTVMQAPEVLSLETYPIIRDSKYHRDSNGNILHVWTEWSGTNNISRNNAYYRYFDATTQTWSQGIDLFPYADHIHSMQHNANGIMVTYGQSSSRASTSFFNGSSFTSPVAMPYYGTYDNAISGYGNSIGSIYTDSAYDLFFQTYNSTSNAWSDATAIESSADIESRYLRMASNGTGYAIMWAERNTINNTYSLKAKVFDGSQWGDNIDLLTDAASISDTHQLVGNSNGYAMLWIADGRVIMNVYDGISNISFLDDVNSTLTPSNPQLVANASGFAAMWKEGQDAVANVYTQGSWGGYTTITSAASGVLAASDAGYIVMFTKSGVGTPNRLYAAHFDGTSWTFPLNAIDQESDSISKFSSIESLGDVYSVLWKTKSGNMNAAVFNSSWSVSSDLGSESSIGYAIAPGLQKTNSGFMALWMQEDDIGRTFQGARYNVSDVTPVWATGNGEYVQPILRGNALGAKLVLNDAGHKLAVWSQVAGDTSANLFYSSHTGTGWSTTEKLPDCHGYTNDWNVASNGSTFMITCQGLWKTHAFLWDGVTLTQTSFDSDYIKPDTLASDGEDYMTIISNSGKLYTAIYDSSAGNWIGPTLLPVSGSSTDSFVAPHVASNGNSFIVAWWQQPPSSIPMYNLIARIYTAGIWSNLALVNTTESSVNPHFNDSTSINTVGQDYLLTWTTDEIYTSRYNSTTGSWSPETLTNTNLSNAARANSASNGTGYHTVWSSSFEGIFSRMYDGTSWSIQALHRHSSFSGEPITESNGSSYVVAWLNYTDPTNLLFMRYEYNEWSLPLFLENHEERISRIELTVNDSNYHAIWLQPDINNTVDPDSVKVWVASF